MYELLANDVVNALTSKKHKINFYKFNNCNFYHSDFICITLGNKDYYVKALKSYNTIVGFIYNGVLYEVGKYSKTTSKQITMFNNTIKCFDRVFFNKIEF